MTGTIVNRKRSLINTTSNIEVAQGDRKKVGVERELPNRVRDRASLHLILPSPPRFLDGDLLRSSHCRRGGLHDSPDISVHGDSCRLSHRNRHSPEPAPAGPARLFRDADSGCRARGASLPGGDSLLGLGGVGVLILHPTAEFVDDEGTSTHGLNNGSTVLRLDYGGTSLLFTGDAEVETDAPILRWGERLRADILKVAHHGSSTSSRQSFVGHLRPETAVISVGAVNNFGHPSTEVLERFREQGTVLYRTDRCGAVMAYIDASGQTTWQTMLANCRAPVGTAVSAVP